MLVVDSDGCCVSTVAGRIVDSLATITVAEGASVAVIGFIVVCSAKIFVSGFVVFPSSIRTTTGTIFCFVGEGSAVEVFIVVSTVLDVVTGISVISFIVETLSATMIVVSGRGSEVVLPPTTTCPAPSGAIGTID
uniref:Uncharacterized protein n=1 Tax=Panagrolaimus superbus TaxID=310955 RepID=A0A914XSA1_9BILA